jgi:hypothetical protein
MKKREEHIDINKIITGIFVRKGGFLGEKEQTSSPPRPPGGKRKKNLGNKF